MRTVYIYALFDPRDNKIRYVGKTIQNPRDRLTAHIRQAKRDNKSHRDRWVLQVLKAEMKPFVEIIEEANEDNWEEREKYWINFYDNLTNETKGGEGLHGHKFSDEHKEKLSKAQLGNKKWLGKKHSEKTKAKMRANMLGENNHNYGKKFSKEYRRKLGNKTGRKHSKETRRKMSEKAKGNQYAKGYKQTDEHKRKLAEARKKQNNNVKIQYCQYPVLACKRLGGKNRMVEYDGRKIQLCNRHYRILYKMSE